MTSLRRFLNPRPIILVVAMMVCALLAAADCALAFSDWALLEDGLLRQKRHRPTIAFCTSELEHITAGGAGVVVADSARALAQAGWSVLIVLDIADEDPKGVIRAWVERARREWQLDWGSGGVGGGGNRGKANQSPGQLHVVALSELAREPNQRRAQFDDLFLWHKSRQWARAVSRIAQACDAIEFWDCGGPAYHTLVWRLEDRIADNSTPHRVALGPAIWVRTHGMHRDIVASSGKARKTRITRSKEIVYSMERRALQLADAVVANGPGTAKQYISAHDLDPARVAVIPPTLGTLLTRYKARERPLNLPGASNILVYGKLQRVKGPDLAAKALVLVMRELSAVKWSGSVIFAGDDMPCDVQPTINMSTCIVEQHVPLDLRHRFRFVGRVKRGGELARLADSTRIGLVILPSRYETFCLAAHEAAYFGLPIVLPRLPAYEGFFDQGGKNAVWMFEPGSANDLFQVVRRVLMMNASAFQRVFTSRTPIHYPDPAVGYARLLDFGLLF